MFYINVSTVRINFKFLNYATTCVRQLEFVHLNLGEGGRGISLLSQTAHIAVDRCMFQVLISTLWTSGSLPIRT